MLNQDIRWLQRFHNYLKVLGEISSNRLFLLKQRISQ